MSKLTGLTEQEILNHLKAMDILLPLEQIFTFKGHISIWLHEDEHNEYWERVFNSVGFKTKVIFGYINIEMYYPEHVDVKVMREMIKGTFHHTNRKLTKL